MSDYFNSPSGKRSAKSITAFKNQIKFANSNLEIKHQQILLDKSIFAALPPQKENSTTYYFGNSPNIKIKESDGGRGFLSEQKENKIKKLMKSYALEKEKCSEKNIYFPTSSPNVNNVRCFNSPTKFPFRDESKMFSPNIKMNTANTPHNSNQKPKIKGPETANDPTTKIPNKPALKINITEMNSQKNVKNNKFFASLRNFSEEILSSTTDFINSNFNKMSDRKKCSCDIGLSKLETCKTALNWFKSHPTKTRMNDLKILYENVQKEKGDEKFLDQIRRDVSRTYSCNGFFSGDSTGYIMKSIKRLMLLERLLMTYSKYDSEIKYCQGMNYIAANLLFHAEETLAFWLFDLLLKKFQIRELYIPNFPGLSKHLQLIDMLIMIHAPEIYSHLCKNNVKSEMFCIPWLFSLFGVLIPIEELVKFYDNFVECGWSYFYKVVITYLNQYKSEILEADSCEILEILSRENYKKCSEKDYKDQRVFWRNILRRAEDVVISQDVIKYLHSAYNSEKKMFKI